MNLAEASWRTDMAEAKAPARGRPSGVAPGLRAGMTAGRRAEAPRHEAGPVWRPVNGPAGHAGCRVRTPGQVARRGLVRPPASTACGRARLPPPLILPPAPGRLSGTQDERRCRGRRSAPPPGRHRAAGFPVARSGPRPSSSPAAIPSPEARARPPVTCCRSQPSPGTRSSPAPPPGPAARSAPGVRSWPATASPGRPAAPGGGTSTRRPKACRRISAVDCPA